MYTCQLFAYKLINYRFRQINILQAIVCLYANNYAPLPLLTSLWSVEIHISLPPTDFKNPEHTTDRHLKTLWSRLETSTTRSTRRVPLALRSFRFFLSSLQIFIIIKKKSSFWPEAYKNKRFGFFFSQYTDFSLNFARAQIVNVAYQSNTLFVQRVELRPAFVDEIRLANVFFFLFVKKSPAKFFWNSIDVTQYYSNYNVNTSERNNNIRLVPDRPIVDTQTRVRGIRGDSGLCKCAADVRARGWRTKSEIGRRRTLVRRYSENGTRIGPKWGKSRKKKLRNSYFRISRSERDRVRGEGKTARYKRV